MVVTARLMCCGWREISNLHITKGHLDATLRSMLGSGAIDRFEGVRCGALLFTQAGTRSAYGVRFAKAIQKAGLGDVIAIPPFKNPNTGRIIKAFVWLHNNETLTKYIQDNLYTVGR